ncbi:unnamed protein product [Rotaria magnacalcarata]|uniref:HAT C-terminal dimerisation domain-containing protein n=6 Tax=Rotaria magnacalcarata TaxID=392030 RepID=A0A814JSR0_9BILA|nr:unnamed protein product [Rotaria magnacalcarata]CAF1352284.1 unnamed protein product [Rotaria magnacalcarata]CAF3974113.1 unnamed protein product [Rotaria magnacalcarata]
MECCQELLQEGEEDPVNFIHRIVAGDDIWVYRHDPLIELESKARYRQGEQTPTRPRRERIKWFRERILGLLNDMVVLDIRHYCSTMLHPKYRSLKCCTKEERLRCQQYIREQLKIIGGIATTATVVQEVEPPPKKFKVADDLFSRFEDDNSYGMEENEDQATGYESDEYTFNDKKPDELDRYLAMEIDKSLLTNNPLDFWKIHSKTFPSLSKLARRVHSIPATSTEVERQFSSAGLIINQCRTNINPEQVGNILLIRSLNRVK